MITVYEAGERAKKASKSIMLRTNDEKNSALLLIAKALREHADMIIEENKIQGAVSGITVLVLPAPHPELGECVALLWEGSADIM